MGTQDRTKIESRQVDHEVEANVGKDIFPPVVECYDTQHEKAFRIGADKDNDVAAKQKEHEACKQIEQENRDAHRIHSYTDGTGHLGFRKTIRPGIL